MVRVALLVANNDGSGARAALRYAEDDAAALAKVLVELGGFRADDVHVVQGQTLARVRSVLDLIRKRVTAGQAAARRIVLLFYFSGHSDGEALEVGRDRWSFGDVKRQLQELGADIRIVVVDSCRSGALLAQKGGTPGPTFDIRFTDDLATTGEAVLTSSAANELALESREIHASFFSHHLVSGLRGAADSSGDGRVTLGEAYRYAFDNTLLATSNTLSGPQHPVYDYRLTGKGELVLTDVLARGATLSLPAMFDRILIADATRQHLVAELTSMSNRRIALPAGRYVIHARRSGRAREGEITVHDGEAREVTLRDLVASDRPAAFIKGDDPVMLQAAGAGPRRVDVAGGVGVTRGAADALPWLATLRLQTTWSSATGRLGWLDLDLAGGHAPGFDERAAYLGIGYGRRFDRGRFGVRVGWRVTGGPVAQMLDQGRTFWSVAFGTGPSVGATVSLVPRWLTLGASLQADGMALRRDGGFEIAFWPAAALTAGASL
ncbi:MAG TPA: caspase family protein [Polyangia bacterium]|nr:caspase family protein [Polyangia bacterium]